MTPQERANFVEQSLHRAMRGTADLVDLHIADCYRAILIESEYAE